MFPTLTSSQKKVYDFYKKFYKDNWILPTLSIASLYLGISRPAVFKHIRNLEAHWYISKDHQWNIYFDNNQIRILWYISCWCGIDLIEDTIDTIDVPRGMLKSNSNHYALIAKWDSMINANIQDGDILIIRQHSHIESGEVWVVVKDDWLVTLKRVYKRASDILLKPENDDFLPMVINNCEIRWKLVWVIRNFD